MKAIKIYLILIFLVALQFSGFVYCDTSLDENTDESNKISPEDTDHDDNKSGFIEDCHNYADLEDGSSCHITHSAEKSKNVPGINVGVKTVFFRLYDSKKKDVNYYKDMHINDPNSLSIFSEKSGYNANLSSVFFIHGFIDNSNRHLSTTLASAFLSRGEVNIFNIDWSKLNLPPYTVAIQHLKLVGYAVAEFLQDSIEKKLIKTSDINLIGHSLGAHLAGYIGRNLNKHPPVIVGLDPAGPEFATNLTAAKLTYSDADCVHFIQTNRLIFGTDFDLGHANYKFNSPAVLQPGCFTPGCSHFRAVEYFAEAVKNPGTFIAISCDSDDDFNDNACHSSQSVIGFPVDTRANGLYFITTNSKPPFGRGPEGMKPEKSVLDQLKKKLEFK